ncbi:hypothetical protein Pse7367_0598 [Thalassoporum mexicanum PCC 7367]|uniref:DUF4926 domain-containing protein n=1 Tax=Thalassoporum mexicanum TaxID=3457544 RepID=UPI00029FECF6|nr:DUF4926 domain-containing protein [Pseudanabaena sp. PCC 7367]AFY68902.1 hypothetical protein Pse7367_0598 [Pseudanabaena sp. PCC 7367]
MKIPSDAIISEEKLTSYHTHSKTEKMMMELELYQDVVLSHDLPEYNLKNGDVAMLIDHVKHPSGGQDGYILEVFNAVGDSIAVVTVPRSYVEHPPTNAVLSVRPISA